MKPATPSATAGKCAVCATPLPALKPGRLGLCVRCRERGDRVRRAEGAVVPGRPAGQGCRHCARRKAAYGKRGLCLACFTDRGVRDQYPVCLKHRPDLTEDGGLTDAEVLALKPVLFGDVGPGPPGVYAPPAQDRKLGDLAAQWAGVGANGTYELHPDTDPEAIRLTHLRLVEGALKAHGADAGAISAAVCLPVWNVRRALFALGLGPDPTQPAERKTGGNSMTTVRGC